MAKPNEDVMKMVRSELQLNPSAGSTELYEKAKKMYRAIGRLSLPQFHGRYSLPVLRERAARRKRGAAGASKSAKKGGGKSAAVKKTPARKKTTARKKTAARKTGRRQRSPATAAAAPASQSSQTPQPTRSAASRANVQEVLLQFAGVVATADKAEMLQLMLRMDSWVDRVIEAAQ